MIWIKLRLKRHFITRRVLQLLSQTCYLGKVQQNELPNLHFKVVSMLTLFNQFICFHLFTNLLTKWFNDTLNIPTRENKSYLNSIRQSIEEFLQWIERPVRGVGRWGRMDEVWHLGTIFLQLHTCLSAVSSDRLRPSLLFLILVTLSTRVFSGNLER